MKEYSIKLLVGPQGEKVCKKLFSLQARFPRLFPKELGEEVGRYLLSCSRSFLNSRSTYLLCKLFISWERLRRRSLSRGLPKIHLILLETNAITYKMAIILNHLQEDEFFNEKQILSAIRNLIPGVKLVPSSYLEHQRGRTHLYYLEITKMKGGFFSIDDKAKLLQELPFECQQRVKSSPSLILTENVENLFKNIRPLSREIRHIDDLPQVMISFIEYSQKKLKFLAVVLRVIKPSTISIQELSSHLPPFIHFSIEKVFCVEKLRKKYPKEASLFTLEVDSGIFMRHNNEVNLREARQYIAKALESMLGEYRDYNGGILNKETEQLAAIKSIFEKKQFPSFPLFEDFFYGIKPLTMRMLLATSAGVEIAFLLKKSMLSPLPASQKCQITSSYSQEADIVIVKTREKEWKQSIPSRIYTYSEQIASSCFEYEEHLYLCFFQQYPKTPLLERAIKKELSHYQMHLLESQNPMLRINFQGGEPPSLNPRLASDIRCHILSNLLFEGLTRINASEKVELAGAEKVEISPDGTLYTFHLRPIFWSNGEKVTAYHFERAWKRGIIKQVAFTRPDPFYPIKNAIKVREKLLPPDQLGVIVKDEHTLSVELEAPCYCFLNLLAAPAFFPLPRESEEPIYFNGPFIVTEWKHDHFLYLSQNPYYWNKEYVKLGGIKISMIRDPKLFYHMFQKGELDMIGDPLSPLPPKVLKQREAQKYLLSKEISRVFWIHCNTNAYPLHNAHLRSALSLALNRKKLAQKVFIKQKPHLSPLPPKYSSYHQGKIEGDPQLALKHFKRALKELNTDLKNFPSLSFTHSDLSFEKALIKELKAEWKEILGISIESRELPWNEFSATLDRADFQLCGLFRRDLFNHPISYLSFFKKSLSKSLGWENEQFERLLESPKLEENLQEMERILIKEAPVIPLVNQTYFVLSHERIQGITWGENGCFNLMDAQVYEKNIFNSPSPFSHYASKWEPSNTKATHKEKANS